MASKAISYNPSWTVKKNAVKNGVSEAVIRNYIRENAIDRRYDRKQIIIDECRKVLKINPNATWTDIRNETGYTFSTIRKYREFITTEKELSDFNQNKIKRRQLRQLNNFYATHPSVVQDILKLESFNHRILEPFCGTGIMAKAIEQKGYEVEAYDIVDRGYGRVCDFAKLNVPEGESDVISNPPYDENLSAFIAKCIEIAKDKVALLLPLNYLAGEHRSAALYSKHPPRTVYVYSNRILVGKNGDLDNPIGNKVNYAWYIWEKGKQKETTELKWIVNDNGTVRRRLKGSDPEELRRTISEKETEEQKNTERIEREQSYLPYPTKADLYKSVPETYDAAKYLCYAFRRKQDLHKDVYIPLGNMNGGFSFEMKGVSFYTSESAYICGLFSNNTPEHIAIQKELLAEKNGYQAKKAIRAKNAAIGRKDWNDFNVEWMLYCVWQKVKSNADFRNILLSIPQGAAIIEDTTFQPKRANDTSAFWGARNEERKKYHTLLKGYFKGQKGAEKNTQKKMNEFCNYGEFVGHNTMGKILMIIKKCLHEGKEPEIDYDLLKNKNIHLLGKNVFPKGFFERKIDFGPLPAKNISDTYLLGTIAGDMIGKPYERKDNAIHTTEFPLFERRCKYTDDTVLTIAVMDWLLSDKNHTWDVLVDRFIHYGTRYRINRQDCCFSSTFKKWLFDENREWGRVAPSNGAAMRVSPVGWYFNSVEEVEEVAKIQASLTHNTPEAIQGAQVAAVAVLLARQKKTKAEIKSFIEKRYGWKLSDDMVAYRKTYVRNFLCKETVEGALVSFLNSKDFESAIRNAVSLGSDSDTVGAITGSIAEAFYGVPDAIRGEVLRRSIPDEFKAILGRFSEAIGYSGK